MRGVVALFLTTWAHGALASGKPDVEAFARVLVERAEVRSGPSEAARTILKVERGETFVVDRRGSDRYWLKIELEDGRTGWVLGDDVEVLAVRSDAPGVPSRSGWLSPPPLHRVRGGMALLAGTLGGAFEGGSGRSWSTGDGIVEARPVVVLAPAVSIEPWIGFARTPDGTLVHGGAWGVLHLLPDLPIDPYVGVGGGGFVGSPAPDLVRRQEDAYFLARAGAGVLFGIRGRILVRLEASDMILFTPSRLGHLQTFLAGLGVYF